MVISGGKYMDKYKLLYEVLRTINYSKTITEVAERLYMSQPYISKVIKENEKKFNVKLVDRKTIPISLTDIGMKMMDDLQLLISTENKIMEDMHHFQNNVGQSIVIYVMNPFLLQSVIESVAILKNNSHHKFTVIDSIDGTIPQAFHRKQVDIVIGKRFNDQTLEIIEIPSPTLCLFAYKTCRHYIPDTLYIPYNKKNLAILNDRIFIANFKNQHFNQFINDTFKNMGIILKNEIIVPAVTDALIAMTHIHNATTLTTYQIASSIFPINSFNLMPLPKNSINLDDTIMYSKMADENVLNIVNELERLLCQQNEEIHKIALEMENNTNQ